MSTGVVVSPNCAEAYGEIKMGRKYRYVLFSITEGDKLIDVTKKAPREATYEDFVADLNEACAQKKGLYAVYEYELSEKNSQLIFVVWIPDVIPVRAKMLYAGSKEGLRKQLVGIKAVIEANDVDEISKEEIEAKLK